MNPFEPLQVNSWQSLHDQLRDDLIKEVFLTRELLSNLHQEEVSLMIHDQGTINQVLVMRSHMLEKLSSLRVSRLQTVEKITRLQESYPSLEEINTEIRSLNDQLTCLTERMNMQQSQNLRLTAHPERIPYMPLQNAAQNRPKRKASVATINIKK